MAPSARADLDCRAPEEIGERRAIDEPEEAHSISDVQFRGES